MARKVYDFRKRASRPMAIDLDAKVNLSSCVWADKDYPVVGEENTIYVSVHRLVRIIDKIRLKEVVYEVVEVKEEWLGIDEKGFNLQKLIVKRIE